MAYTPEQVAAINTAREANVAAGRSAYSGAGATPYSIATGQSSGGTLETTSPFDIGAMDIGGLNTLGIDISKLSAGLPENYLQSVSDIISKTAGLVFQNEEQRKQWEAIQEQVYKQQEGAFQTRAGMLAQRPQFDMTGAIQTLQQQYGIPQSWSALQGLIPDIASLQTRLAALEAREQQGLLAIEGQPIALPAITGEQAQFKKLIAAERSGISAELGAKAAIAEMYRGNIQMARSLISDTVQALMFDYNQKVVEFDMFYDLYGEFIDTLDKRTQNALDMGYDALIHDRDRAEAEYDQKLQWYVEAISKNAGEPYSFGQIKTISLEEAGKRYAERMATVSEVYAPTQYTKEWQEAGGLEGTGMTRGEYIMWRVGGEEELTPTEETKEEVESTFKTLRDVYGLDRKAVEEKWKTDNGVSTMSPFVSSVLDNLYPDTAMSKMEEPEKGFWEKEWWIPFIWERK